MIASPHTLVVGGSEQANTPFTATSMCGRVPMYSREAGQVTLLEFEK